MSDCNSIYRPNGDYIVIMSNALVYSLYGYGYKFSENTKKKKNLIKIIKMCKTCGC